MDSKSIDEDLVRALKRFRRAVEKFGVERMILFGSRAAGGEGESSDVDILVVSPEEDKLSLLSRLYHEWHIELDLNYPVDFLCYTPEEYETMKEGITLVREAVQTGIEIPA